MGDCTWSSDRNLRRATATGRLDDQFHVAVPRRLSPLLPSRKLCEASRSPVQCSGAAAAPVFDPLRMTGCRSAAAASAITSGTE